MKVKTIEAAAAPTAIGPYSHATIAGGLVFCSGQTPLDPNTGELVGATVAEQTVRVFANLRLVLGAAGTTLDRVVKTTVFLADMADFAVMNRVYSQEFGSHRPARTTVAVRENPLGALVEIECIASIGD